jgi:hypothetical protein
MRIQCEGDYFILSLKTYLRKILRLYRLIY